MDEHVVVVDLGYGDAGKGTVVDWLCARGPARTVVRFNGGAQAAHNVVAPDGRHHTFAQFGSGTLTPGVRTHLSRFMLVDPLALAAEARHLAALGVPDALDRLTVDRDALLTTPYHRAAGRAREAARGAGRHGSCGMGIGETAAYALEHPADAPRAGDCASPARLRRLLVRLRDRCAAVPGCGPLPDVADCADAFAAFAARVRLVGGEHLARLLRSGPVVFEGAQGVLLDEWHGFHPHTTWSTTTFANAATLLAEAGAAAVRLGVLRTYTTRHGPGPFVTEDPALTEDLPDRHNRYGRWQGAFRVGHLDLVALRYALEVAGGADALALTHLDVAQARTDLRICTAYEMAGQRVERLPAGPPGDLDRQAALTRALSAARPVYTAAPADWPAAIGTALGPPVTLVSTGPTRTDKHLVRPAARPRSAG
ncbi:adenylosuccinate synthetase [Actinomadura craniellae]|uniref:Adenylosuccinate synthetase n=1 Tax=Actinomadura craniellae TaxID=2231787 RepID=A0A365H4R5_9ACTN|nr:adenylosuccinate synthetase [Actinomadura craniellae]RAY13213.1 adenylosuccinate synthetase [Actinomadura craniellae]